MSENEFYSLYYLNVPTETCYTSGSKLRILNKYYKLNNVIPILYLTICYDCTIDFIFYPDSFLQFYTISLYKIHHLIIRIDICNK